MTHQQKRRTLVERWIREHLGVKTMAGRFAEWLCREGARARRSNVASRGGET